MAVPTGLLPAARRASLVSGSVAEPEPCQEASLLPDLQLFQETLARPQQFAAPQNYHVLITYVHHRAKQPPAVTGT